MYNPMYGMYPPWASPPPNSPSPTLADIIAAKEFFSEMEKGFTQKEKEKKEKEKGKPGSWKSMSDKKYNVWHLTAWLIILSPIVAPLTRRWFIEIGEILFK